MKTFIIAETSVNMTEVYEMLSEIGARDWHTNAYSLSELLIEICGRICYKSFGTDLNKNLTRVREGNREYIENILMVKHGSVVEHASTTVAIIGCSRILTHELVRHRAGVAISQESQRFVRLEEFDMYIPSLDDPFEKLIRHVEPDLSEEKVKENVALLTREYVDAIEDIKQNVQTHMGNLTRILEHDRLPFDIKKQITSALRRFVPGGVNTNIIITANHRAWRHMISMRTAPGAEVEIREVFNDIANKFRERYPALYQDMQQAYKSGDSLPHQQFTYDKI